MKKLHLYNFEFPWGCNQLDICDYKFVRASDYEKQFKSLQHWANGKSEFQYQINTGGHAVTGTVIIPKKQQLSIVYPRKQNRTALDDILLILSIVSQRDVFAIPNIPKLGEIFITKDPRHFYYGLSTATKFITEWISDDEIKDAGYQVSIEESYESIKSMEWKKLYRGYKGQNRKGTDLILYFYEACKYVSVEIRYLICWAIWERLFMAHNKKWILEDTISKMNAKEKIAFVSIEYNLMDYYDSKRMKSLQNKFVNLRNSVVHGCAIFNQQEMRDAHNFMLITELILANILNLYPKDVHNAKDYFKNILFDKPPPPTFEERMKSLNRRPS